MRRPAASVCGLWCAPADPRGGRDRVRVTACVPTATLSSQGVQLGHGGGVCVCGRRGRGVPTRRSAGRDSHVASASPTYRLAAPPAPVSGRGAVQLAPLLPLWTYEKAV